MVFKWFLTPPPLVLVQKNGFFVPSEKKKVKCVAFSPQKTSNRLLKIGAVNGIQSDQEARRRMRISSQRSSWRFLRMRNSIFPGFGRKTSMKTWSGEKKMTWEKFISSFGMMIYLCSTVVLGVSTAKAHPKNHSWFIRQKIQYVCEVNGHKMTRQLIEINR